MVVVQIRLIGSSLIITFLLHNFRQSQALISPLQYPPVLWIHISPPPDHGNNNNSPVGRRQTELGMEVEYREVVLYICAYFA